MELVGDAVPLLVKNNHAGHEEGIRPRGERRLIESKPSAWAVATVVLQGVGSCTAVHSRSSSEGPPQAPFWVLALER